MREVKAAGSAGGRLYNLSSQLLDWERTSGTLLNLPTIPARLCITHASRQFSFEKPSYPDLGSPSSLNRLVLIWKSRPLRGGYGDCSRYSDMVFKIVTHKPALSNSVGLGQYKELTALAQRAKRGN